MVTAAEACSMELARYLATNGKGEDWWGEPWACPDWYVVIRTARYFHVAPWEMVAPGTAAKIGREWWLLWAMISEGAEAKAEQIVRKGLA